MTADAIEAIAEQLNRHKPVLIQDRKPYTLNELARALSEAVDRRD